MDVKVVIGERKYTMIWCGLILRIVLLTALSGCVTYPSKPDADLTSLLEAYKQQNAQLDGQRQQGQRQGIKDITITKGAGTLDSLVTVNLQHASLPAVIQRILEQTEVPFLLNNTLPNERISARFDKVPLQQALNYLLTLQGFSCVAQDGLLVIKENSGGDTSSIDTATGTPAPTSSPVSSSPSPATPASIGTSTTPVAPPASGISKDAAEKSAAATVSAPTPTVSSVSSSETSGPPPDAIARTIPLKYLDVATAANLLGGLYPTTTSSYGSSTPTVTYGQQPKTNTLFLFGPPNDVDKAAAIVRKADRNPSHVLIEALVIEFDADVFEQFAADISKLSSGPFSNIITNFGSLTGNALNFTYMPGAGNRTELTAFINVLVSLNKARLISRPYVSTLSGETANINITRNRYVVVETGQNGATVTATSAVSSGVVMNITPTVLPDDMIRMTVDVEDSQFIPTVQDVAVEVDKNAAQTVMRVESGQTIVIGGLVLNRHTTGNSGLPWLRSVPGVNLLFADQELSRSEQEILIYVTPHIWTPDMTTPLVEPQTYSTRGEGDATDFEKKLPDVLQP